MCLSLFKVFYIVILVNNFTYIEMCSVSGRAYEKLVTLVAFGQLVTSLCVGGLLFSFFKSLIIIRTKRRKANQNLQSKQVTVSQIPVNWFLFKRSSPRLLQKKVILMVTMLMVPSMILSLWTHSVKVWRHFQQMPENQRIPSLPCQICWTEQVSLLTDL